MVGVTEKQAIALPDLTLSTPSDAFSFTVFNASTRTHSLSLTHIPGAWMLAQSPAVMSPLKDV